MWLKNAIPVFFSLWLTGCQSFSGQESWLPDHWPWQQHEPIPTVPAPQHNAEVEALIAKGELALTKDQLSVPVSDSALFYYRQALKLDPDNPYAQRGVRQVAKRYRHLARTAHDNGDDKMAKRYLKQSESIVGVDHPGNVKLRVLLDQTPSGQNPRALDKGIKEDIKARKAEAESAGKQEPQL